MRMEKDEDNLPNFIQMARSSLVANGSKFIDYMTFLQNYTKDTKGQRFEHEARAAGWTSGRQALEHYRDSFEFQGHMVRRIDTQEIGHIMKTDDNSKPKVEYPSWNNAPIQRVNNFIPDTTTCYFLYESERQNNNNGSGIPRFQGQPNMIGSYRDSRTGLFIKRAAELNNNPTFNLNALEFGLKLPSDKTKVKPQPTVFVDQSRTASFDRVEAKLFKFIADLYLQGKKMVLQPEALEQLIKDHSLSADITLKNLRYLLVFWKSSFNVRGATAVISVQSNISEPPKLEPQVLHSLLISQPVVQPLYFEVPFLCQILNALRDDQSLFVLLTPLHWIVFYDQLDQVLTNYATQVDLLTPLDYVFKEDRALHFDSVTSKFYRCCVISGADKQQVNVFLVDEAHMQTVPTDSLYEMPSQIEQFHDMSFGVKLATADGKISVESLDGVVTRLRQSAFVEHQISVVLEDFEMTKFGVSFYAGSVGQIQ